MTCVDQIFCRTGVNCADDQSKQILKQLIDSILEECISGVVMKPSSHFLTLTRLIKDVESNNKEFFQSSVKSIFLKNGQCTLQSHRFETIVESLAEDTGLSWGRIISVFTFLKVWFSFCIENHTLCSLSECKEVVARILEDKVLPWIITNGGWIGIDDMMSRKVACAVS